MRRFKRYSVNPWYPMHLGRRTQRFAKLPSLEQNYKHNPKPKAKENGRFVSMKELLGMFKPGRHITARNLLDAGYEICLSPTMTVRKVKSGAVSRYMVKGI